MIIGYARVSTDGQTLDAQQAALRAAGAERVYSEKISGAITDRPALAKALAALASGDTLVVCKLDRLARSTRDLLNTLDAIGKVGATFKSLGDGWADTTTPHGRLMLTVLGGLAEFERHLILGAQFELLLMTPLEQIPDVELVAVTAAQQDLRIHSFVHHVGRSPFAGDDGVEAQVPPEIIRKFLRAAIQLPLPEDIEALVIHHENSTWTTTVRSAQRAD